MKYELSEFVKMVAKHEGMVLEPYKDSLGISTIGIGRNLEDRGITDTELDYIGKTLEDILEVGLTEEEAIELLKKDIDEANVKVRDKIQDFDSFPFYLKMELVNSAYRGLIQDSPNTLELINKGDFAGAAKEFTNNVPAYKESKGIKKRMDRVVDALNRYAEEVDE